MPRKRHVLGGVVLGLAMGASGGALGMAWLHPPVDTTPISNATSVLMVTATAEERPVRDLFVISGQITPPSTLAVMPTDTGPSVRQVVSGKTRPSGYSLHFGDVIAEVSGRPVFAVPASLPLFRDIVSDITGPDVAGLQKMLKTIGIYSGTASGKADKATIEALAKLFTHAGYTAPNPVRLALSDTAPVPANGLHVQKAAAVGSQIGEDNPLATVVMTKATIRARVDMLQAGSFKLGAGVKVQIGSAVSVPSTVVAVSGYQDGAAGLPPGYDITVAMPASEPANAAAALPVTVTEVAQIPQGLAVPLTAIRYNSNGGTYVLLPPSSTTSPSSPHQVPVDVVGQSNGYAIIAAGTGVDLGTVVIISGG